MKDQHLDRATRDRQIRRAQRLSQAAVGTAVLGTAGVTALIALSPSATATTARRAVPQTTGTHRTSAATQPKAGDDAQVRRHHHRHHHVFRAPAGGVTTPAPQPAAPAPPPQSSSHGS